MMKESTIRYLEFSEIKEYLSEISSTTILLVIDQQVHQHYGDRLVWSDIFAGKKVIEFITPGGEGCKSLAEYQRCFEFFLQAGVNRKSHLLAVGGGATTDLAGFVAATLLRGISWSVLSTTLLSSVDAAVGGKVGINTVCGKNLLGAFHFPEQIYIVPEFFNTLPTEEMKSGWGEILKYAFLDKMIGDMVAKKRPLKELIRSCVDYKKRIVAQDPHEDGVRRILNLGHTFGHAFEVLGNMPHGLAVVAGMDFIFKAFKADKALAKFYELAPLCPLDIANPAILWQTLIGQGVTLDQVWEFVLRDKKISTQTKIEVVTVRDIGYHVIEEMELSKLRTMAEGVWNQ